MPVIPYLKATTNCSHCHEQNDTDEQFCSSCGHEAHVARMDCQCAACVGSYLNVTKGKIYEH